MYDFTNKLGHIAKLVAFYLVYRAILVTGLKEPFEVVFRTLKQTEHELRNHQETLEDRIRERTASLETEVEERIQAEKALQRLNRELRAISNCNEVLVRAEDEQMLLKEICRIVCEEAGYRMAFVGYAENDDAKTVRPVAWAGVEDDYLAQARLTWADTERGRGPAGVAIRNVSTDCSQDIATDLRMAPWRENALQRGYRSTIALPLKDETENIFGVFLIYSSEPNAFTPDEIRLMEELAGDLAFGIMVLRARIERKRAEEALNLQAVELEQEVAERQTAQENLQEKALLLEEEIEKRQKAQDELEQLNERLEQRVQERTTELEEKNTELARLNRIFVGRELRMVELKERIRELESNSEKTGDQNARQ